MKSIITICLFFFFTINMVQSQNSDKQDSQISTIEGVIRDENGVPIINAIASCNGKEVVSDLFGNYSIEVPSDKAVKISFSHPSFQSYSRRIRIRKKKVTIFSPKLLNNLTMAF